MISNFVKTLLPLTAFGCVQGNAATPKKQQKPNIIYIMCDDMGYGDLGCYGQQYILTPNIDRMAKEGMRFTQAYAGAPVSAPSRACFMTGQHSGHTEVRGNKEYWAPSKPIYYGKNRDFSVVGQHPYDPEHVILPEIMKDNGYRTGMFGKWAGGYEGSKSTPRKDYSADLIHQHALSWLKRQSKDKPFFGIFTYTLPHAELAQPEDSLVAFYKKKFFVDKTWGGQEASRYNAVEHTHAQFAAMITRLDAYVGEILRTLDEQGLAENTLVIFTSDNGPHEEGGADPAFFNRDGKLRGVKRQCYEGGIRIPFIARWKGNIKENVTNNLPFAFYDLMPTFCDVAGVRNFPKQFVNKKKTVDYFDGISIFPTLMSDEKAQKKHPYLYWEFAETNQIAVRMGDWKLVVIRGVPHLYNLATDLHEDRDVAQEHPNVVDQMVTIIYQEHVDNPLFPITMPMKRGK